MAFDVSLLPNYVDQNRFPLLRKAIFGGKTIGLLSKQTGIKSSATLNLIDDSVYFQEGEGCANTPSGSTTFSQRTIVTGKIKVEKEWCVDALEPKYTQHALLAGANEDALPFEEELMNGQLEQINKLMEIAVWQGDTTSSNPNLAHFDGLLKNISGSTGYITANTGTFTAITDSNVIDILNEVYSKIPDDILQHEDTVVFVGTDVYRRWVKALTKANMYHYVSDGTKSNMEFIIPGTDILVIAVLGLSQTNTIVAGRLSNFFFGTDLENDMEKFDVYYFPKDETFTFRAKWRAGTQIAFPDQVVYFKV